MKRPPFTSSETPLMYKASSDARNAIAAACSSADESRWIGISACSAAACAARSLAISPPWAAPAAAALRIIGVSTPPGQIALTRTPRGP